MGILKIAADYMDSAMNNERLNMGKLVANFRLLIHFSQ